MKTLEIKSIGYATEQNRVIFNFRNPECAGLAHGVPVAWFGKQLASFGITSVTAAHIELLVEFNGISAQAETIEILPAGSILEGREEPLKKDSLQLGGFSFKVSALAKLRLRKELTADLLEGMPILFEASVKEATTAPKSAALTAAMAAAEIADEE